jgi:hypothetical protein
VPPFPWLRGKEGICDVVANVPDVGNVTEVTSVIVKVLANAPDVAKLPPSVRVKVPLLIPVPPLFGANNVVK